MANPYLSEKLAQTDDGPGTRTVRPLRLLLGGGVAPQTAIDTTGGAQLALASTANEGARSRRPVASRRRAAEGSPDAVPRGLPADLASTRSRPIRCRTRLVSSLRLTAARRHKARPAPVRRYQVRAPGRRGEFCCSFGRGQGDGDLSGLPRSSLAVLPATTHVD